VSDLEFDGERFIPGVRGGIWIEHWHRYHFAAPCVAGRRVLDVACGEGYGSALLARHAASVVGVDVAAAAVEHASRTYGAAANLRFLEGSCTALPLPDASIDVAVSFETVEHIEGQEAFVDELARVLVPGGLLLLSCPNKAEYSDRRHFTNEFHVKELYRAELEALLSRRFPHLAWFGQKPTFFSVIAPESRAASGALVEVPEEDPSRGAALLSEPLYFIVAAARERAALDALGAPLHVLSDRGDWTWRDYEKVMRWMEAAVAERDEYKRRLEERERERPAPASPRGLRTWLRGLLS
jgi:ubiquinone/menaquinone biosynthesis C-methylase UbiE